MPDFTLDPARTALINVDMQKCLAEGSPLASEIIARYASRWAP